MTVLAEDGRWWDVCAEQALSPWGPAWPTQLVLLWEGCPQGGVRGAGWWLPGMLCCEAQSSRV